MKAYIYCIRNLITNKTYVGSTKNLELRKYEHFYHLRKGTHHSPHLQASFNKYGEANFTFSVLEECLPADRLKREIHHINNLSSYLRPYGYNTYEPNESKFRCSSDTKSKLRNSSINRNYSVAVDIYTTTGELVGTYPSIKECASTFRLCRTALNGILKGKRKSIKGFTVVLRGEPFSYRPSKMQRNMSSYYKK